MTDVAALYVYADGPYAGLPGVDLWDAERDARRYDGPYPVVAHPPCSSWCKLAPINAARYGHRIGDDGGCFAHALDCVRRFGGVLEHPAGSYAWPHFGLPRPSRGGWTRDPFDGGWVCEVSQSAYGHQARKRTWLYYVGDVPPPSLDWSSPRGTAVVSYADQAWGDDRPRISKRAASVTPPAFRDALIEMARSARRAS